MKTSKPELKPIKILECQRPYCRQPLQGFVWCFAIRTPGGEQEPFHTTCLSKIPDFDSTVEDFEPEVFETEVSEVSEVKSEVITQLTKPKRVYPKCSTCGHLQSFHKDGTCRMRLRGGACPCGAAGLSTTTTIVEGSE